MRNFYDRILALVVVLGLLIAGAGFAHAGSYEDALEKFTTDDYADTADAVTAVATSGSALAAPLIAALQDGRLMFSAKDKKVFIKTADDKLIDAGPASRSRARLRTMSISFGSITGCAASSTRPKAR